MGGPMIDPGLNDETRLLTAEEVAARLSVQQSWVDKAARAGDLPHLLVGRYRMGAAGGGPGIETPPDRIIAHGPYRYTRNPMYLGHLIFMLGLALTFWSAFALILFVARAAWFHARVLGDEARLEQIFGAEYAAYRSQVKRWIPGVF